MISLLDSKQYINISIISTFYNRFKRHYVKYKSLLGNLRIENFFKESDCGVVENILVKLKEVTVTRGIMTLTSTLEMQVHNLYYLKELLRKRIELL